MPELSPNAAVMSNKLYVDNDQMRDNTFDLPEQRTQARSAGSSMFQYNQFPFVVLFFDIHLKSLASDKNLSRRRCLSPRRLNNVVTCL